ncbi:MAG TPA: VIT domain-containing protein, partial [Thermoanaerobaculia bacterium]|nr:VIT domain-containing protein [Thermoanaerobaculia bacterium]
QIESAAEAAAAPQDGFVCGVFCVSLGMQHLRALSLAAFLVLLTVGAVLMSAKPQTSSKPQPEASQRSEPLRLDASKPREARREATPPVPPITFADPDGQELILEELSVRTAVHGMLSLTEMELRFRNPQERRIEGRFTCTLPPNAAISRFAKDVNGHLMEGEVVERLRANQVYESYLHQMRDPALLEQEQGNRFSARIFPIEPKAPVHLVVSWTQLLPLDNGARTYALPLRGLDKVKKLTFKAFVTPLPEAASGKLTTSTAEVTSFEETDWTPDKDIVLSWPARANDATVLRAGDFYLAALRPNVAVTNRATPSAWTLYVDTSASSAEGAPHRIRAIEELLDAMPSGTRVQLVAFDQDVVPLASGTASELSRRAGSLLRERLFLGGTDIGALLRHINGVLRDEPSRGVVIASDLVPTVGTVAAHEVKVAIDALPQRATVHALILGSREDAPTAKAITAGRGRIIRVPFTESLAASARDAAEQIRKPLGGSFDVSDDAAEWIYPSHFDDVQPGDEVIALARLKPGREPNVARVSARSVDSKTFGPLLEREAYRAYLEYLAGREANEPSDAVRRALATEQVRISTQQRVVIPRTTMLVLENEWEYQRWGLDRRALAAILTIEAGGIGRIDRRSEQQWAGRPIPVMAAPMPELRRQRGDRAQPKESPAPPPVVAAPVTVPAAEAPADLRVISQAADEELEEGVETGVSGGIEGGVAGGVVGGVVGGVPSAVASDDARATSAPAPRMMRREEPPARKRPRSEWTSRRMPTREDVVRLERKLKDDPRDRELYNQLSEALALLGDWDDLRGLALRWQPYDPENPQVYEVLGMADTELGRENEAARAFASLIEVAPGKPELLQRAGLLLLRTRRASLAEAPLRRALELRPDRANAYRHLALLLWRDGRIEEAARVLETATRQEFPNWYGGVKRVVREELGYVYRAWAKKDPAMRREIEERAREHDVDLDRSDALRITLAWETDANDVDLHVVDPSGEEVYYSHRQSDSGLQLYEDITQGLGPEVIRASRAYRGTYHVGVRYFAAGPMGISRGVVIVMRDGDVDIHPFRLAKGGEDIRYVAGVKVN